MSEEPASKYPRIIWTAKDGKHRIVQTAVDRYAPEQRGVGFERWNSVNGWIKELADDYCKALGEADG